MRIKVIKGSIGDKPAPDITDKLLSSTESGLARGHSYLNGIVDAYQHNVFMPMVNMIETGIIAEVVDSDYGEVHIGKVESVRIDISGTGVNMTISVERPA